MEHLASHDDTKLKKMGVQSDRRRISTTTIIIMFGLPVFPT